MTTRFWSDVRTVLHKEQLEWTATRGCFIQPAVIVAIFGGIVPFALGRLWAEQAAIHWLWSWLPLLLSAGLVADTFAGERERDTLEALLASRLPDRAILFGKTAAVAAYGWTITLICWAAGSFVVSLSQGAGSFILFPAMLLVFPILSLLAAWYVAGVGVLISLHAQSVQTAQQWMSIAMLGTLLLAGMVAARLFDAADAQTSISLVAAAGVLATLDLGLLLALLVRPQRNEWLIH